MALTHRMYETEDDLYAMQRASARWAQQVDHCGYIHPGDIAHRLGNGIRARYPLHEAVRLTEHDGELIAWTVTFFHWQSFEVQMRPDLRGGSLHRELVNWAETRVRERFDQYQDADDPENGLYWDIFVEDTASTGLAADLGYRLTSQRYRYTTRPLTTLPQTVLPPGYSIRPTHGESEVDALIAVHSGAFNSTWTREEYLHVMRGPGYDPQREWVVVAPDGRFAAFTVTWHDPLNRTGLFEPVGTHADFQRKGLGRALMTHVMHQMRAAGLEHAIVWHESDNPASSGLYAALGFLPKFTIQEHKRPLTSF